MSKKEKNPSPAGEQEQAPQEAQQPQEVTEEYRQEETPETFTVTREKETIYQDAKLDTIAKFLEVYDNLERAASQTGDEDNVHKQGMVMIFNQLRNVLEKMGVTIDAPQGQPFDPARHNAVMHVDDENLGEGIVSQVFQKGFLLGERVIRCATVQVAN